MSFGFPGYMYVYVNMYMNIYIYMYVYVYVCMCVYIYVYTQILYGDICGQVEGYDTELAGINTNVPAGNQEFDMWR